MRTSLLFLLVSSVSPSSHSNSIVAASILAILAGYHFLFLYRPSTGSPAATAATGGDEQQECRADREQRGQDGAETVAAAAAMEAHLAEARRIVAKHPLDTIFAPVGAQVLRDKAAVRKTAALN